MYQGCVAISYQPSNGRRKEKPVNVGNKIFRVFVISTANGTIFEGYIVLLFPRKTPTELCICAKNINTLSKI